MESHNQKQVYWFFEDSLQINSQENLQRISKLVFNALAWLYFIQLFVNHNSCSLKNDSKYVKQFKYMIDFTKKMVHICNREPHILALPKWNANELY